MRRQISSLLILLVCVLLSTELNAQQLIGANTYRVERVKLTGNTVFSADELKAQLNLHSGRLSTFGIGAEFNKRVMQLDVITLESHYRSNGYINVTVSDSFYVGKNRKVEVFFHIAEGQQYYFTGIAIHGNLIMTDAQIREYFSDLNPGDPYNPYQFQESIDALQTAYENAGKPFADIQYRIDARGTDVYINLEIEEGQTVFVDEIRISGLSAVNRNVVRREMLLRQGDQYSGEEIRESQRRIFETGLFADVNIRPIPGSADSQQVNLHVSVRELDFRTLRFDLGAGQYQVATSAEPVPAVETSIEWFHRNLVRSGRRLSASSGLLFNFTDPGNSWPSAEVSYTEPWLGAYRVPTTLRLFYKWRTYDVSNLPLQEWGTDLTFQHTQRRELTLRSVITWQQILLPEGTAISDTILRNQERSFAFLFRRDTRENFLYPKQGFVLEVEPKLFGGVLGGTSNFYQVEVSVSKFWESFKNSTLAGRILVGSLHTYEAGADIPEYKLYRLGGATSVRGFETDKLKVAYDPGSDRYVAAGDKVKLIMNLELRFPIIWHIGGEIFLDAGQLESDYSKLEILSMRHTAGIGITFATPLGPARLDFGRKLDPRSYENPWTINLALQYAF